jgi:hypothetical protein
MGGVVMDNNGNTSGHVRFNSVLQAEVPKGRDGKHKQIILRILGDLELVSAGSALKIPLSELPDTKENIRSALSRAARKTKTDIATSSDDSFLYVWKTGETSLSKAKGAAEVVNI